MPTSATPPTRLRTTRRFDQDTGQIVLREEFQAFGTALDVLRRIGQNAQIPRLLDRWPFYTDINASPVEQDLRVIGESLENFNEEPTVHRLTLDYADFVDPNAAVFGREIGTEIFMLKFDENGKPILPGSRDGIPIEVPTIEASSTETVTDAALKAERLVPHIGKTNSEPWQGLDEGQWVFLGASLPSTFGRRTSRATFRFRGFLPLNVGFGETAEARGRNFYYFDENPDGSARKPLNAVPVREEIDFDTLFSTREIEE